MPKVDEIRAHMEKQGVPTAKLNNLILSPYDSSGQNLYMLSFHSVIPSEIMFYSYGATVTLELQYDANPKQTFTLNTGNSETFKTPAGTKRINASATS